MTLVYRFEGIDDALDLVPLAARRALDGAGTRLSLASWRAMSIEDRRALVAVGAEAEVRADAVRSLLGRARAAFDEVVPVEEPSADAVPERLGERVTAEVWSALSPLARYALDKVARGKHPAETLAPACAEIAPLSTHTDARGRARMVDVADKPVTKRRAVARGRVTMQRATAARLRAGDVAKGDVLGTARIAAIQAAKRTSELIPLCHLIALTRVVVELEVEDGAVVIEAAVEAMDRTGVEMEALAAASVAALTVYDMLKSVDRAMKIEVELTEKEGGRSGRWRRGEGET